MNKFMLVGTLVATVALAGCQNTGPNQAIGTGVGAVGGYAIGRSLGGGAAGSALGAVAGAVIGSEVGRNMDQQPQGYPVYPRERVIVQERPVYYERRHVERCDFVRQWDNRIGAYRDIRICR
jgi:osmotically inducible lipoprotein OsmB